MREEKKHAEVGKRVRNTRKDQSMAGVINFILTGVHAACMQSAREPADVARRLAQAQVRLANLPCRAAFHS